MRLSGLFIYPIKACGGMSLEQADVALRGLAFDRRYMIVDRSGNFVTQRERAQLCLVSATLSHRQILVSAPDTSPIELPCELHQGEPVPFQIWEDFGSGLRHPQGSRWFSELLGDDVSLVYMPDSERRAVNPPRARPGDLVSFADGYPFLLISEASLADLNGRLGEPLEMRRFRPNLVISGCEPYAEDHFERLQIGPVSFRAVKRCERCVVTTINPQTARAGKEPLRTLAQYRQEDSKVWFGMNLIHDGSGSLELGDDVSLLA